jgi:hypothetical protein
MPTRSAEEAGLEALRPPPPGAVDDPTNAAESGAEAAEQHQALVRSLADLLAAAPSEIEELLDLIHAELEDGDRPASDATPDAFERGLELGLLVGFGSRGPGRRAPVGETEASAPSGR